MAQMKQKRETLDGWATGILLQAHAIAPCPDHGFMRLRFNHRSVDYAHALATHQPYKGLSKAKCIVVIDEVLDGLGDQCPACD